MYELNKNPHPPRAFTLVELLVSIALLALLLFGTIQLFSRALGAGRLAEKLTVATYLAQAQIETILGAEYATLASGTFEARHRVLQQFDRQTIVQFIDPTTLNTVESDQGLKRVIVTVFYPAPQGERSLVLPLIIARH